MARRKKPVRNIYPYARCHVLRHNFDAVGPIPGITLKPRYGRLVTWRCLHCSTVRLDVVDHHGDLQYRDYLPPPDYKHERLTMAEWRLMLFREMDDALLIDVEEGLQG